MPFSNALVTGFSGLLINASNRALLDLFLIEKAAYEIGYEAANRPSWLPVPLAGLSRLAQRVLDRKPGGAHG